MGRSRSNTSRWKFEVKGGDAEIDLRGQRKVVSVSTTAIEQKETIKKRQRRKKEMAMKQTSLFLLMTMCVVLNIVECGDNSGGACRNEGNWCGHTAPCCAGLQCNPISGRCHNNGDNTAEEDNGVVLSFLRRVGEEKW